jgi:adenylylsulfate kinase
LGFAAAERAENIRRVAEVAKLFVQAGIIPIVAFITPLRELRELARAIISTDDLIEVYVEASIENCARRDPKGLYARAGGGRIQDFTGCSAPFEPPEPAGLVVNTDNEPVEHSVERLHQFVLPRLERSSR